MSNKKSHVYRIVDSNETLRSRLFDAVENDDSTSVDVIAQLHGELIPIPFSDDEMRYAGLIDEQRAYFPIDRHTSYAISLFPEIARVALGKYFESFGTAKLPDGTQDTFELTTHISETTVSSTDIYDLVIGES